MQYRCVATSVEGLVQQVACCYLPHGYWFHVSGYIPEHKDPARVDAKLMERYGINLSRWSRVRRKRAGHANIQYIRHGRFFLLLSTHGRHPFFEDEGDQVRDARRSPVRYAGYSMSFRGGHSHIRIELEEYRNLKAMLFDLSTRRPVGALAKTFRELPYEPYAPVRRQLLNLWRAVNRQRKAAALPLLPIECIRLRRRIVRPFESRLDTGLSDGILEEGVTDGKGCEAEPEPIERHEFLSRDDRGEEAVTGEEDGTVDHQGETNGLGSGSSADGTGGAGMVTLESENRVAAQRRDL